MSEHIHHGKKEIEVANDGETTALLPKPNPKKKEKKKEEKGREEERRRGGKGRRGEKKSLLTFETKNGVVNHFFLCSTTFFASTRKTRTTMDGHTMNNIMSHELFVGETSLFWCTVCCLPTTS
jgi:hypothetical protein